MKNCSIVGYVLCLGCLLHWCYAALLTPTANMVDICTDDTVGVLNAGAGGTVGIGENSIQRDTPNPCVLRLRACSACQISIQLNVDNNFKFFCGTSTYSPKQCSIGCDYLYMFDMYYMNETLTYYRQWETFSFVSQSSQVFVVVCHGDSQEYRISMNYTVIKKHEEIQGNSAGYHTGAIQSPFFPAGYAQNHETYEYQFTSTSQGDYIYLQFDDWHLADTTALYFEDSNIAGPVYGRVSRPVVISNGNKMRMVFHTGQAIGADQKREYLGWRATYVFIRDRNMVSSPKTNCDGAGYMLQSRGGEITVKWRSPAHELVDCVWVVKAQPGFSGVSLKIIKKQLRSPGVDQIQIRAGLTSEGKLLATLNHDTDLTTRSTRFDNKHGFYIRVNTLIVSGDEIIMAYASYKDPYSPTGCTWDENMFTCTVNHRCIDKSLNCDGYDHCGDNSDEIQGCQVTTEEWDQSYQYTITVGVIVPIVISVFLIMVLCLVFVMVRRCRAIRRREAGLAEERLRTVSEEVAEDRGRRHRRRRSRPHWFRANRAERDLPPSYTEAMQNPPGWYLNVAFGSQVDPSLPRPPSYSEVVGGPMDPPDPADLPRPSSTDSSSQSEVTIHSRNPSISSSSSEGDSEWMSIRTEVSGRTGRCGRHASSSESEDELHDVPRSSVNTPDLVTMATSSAMPENETSSPKPTGDKNLRKPRKVTDDDGVNKKPCVEDAFVIPDGPKLGSELLSESAADTNATDARHAGPTVAGIGPGNADQTAVPETAGLAPAAGMSEREPATHERSPSLVSGSSAAESPIARPRPRSRKSHPRKQRKVSSKRSKPTPADRSATLSVTEVPTTEEPFPDPGDSEMAEHSRRRNGHQVFREPVIEGRNGDRPGDGVMVVYDSNACDYPGTRREPCSSPGPPQYLLASPVPMDGDGGHGSVTDTRDGLYGSGSVCEDAIQAGIGVDYKAEPAKVDGDEAPSGRQDYRATSPAGRGELTDHGASHGNHHHGDTGRDSPRSCDQDLSITSGYRGNDSDVYLDTSVTSGHLDPTGTVDGLGDTSVVSGDCDVARGHSEYLNLYRMGEEDDDVYV